MKGLNCSLVVLTDLNVIHILVVLKEKCCVP